MIAPPEAKLKLATGPSERERCRYFWRRARLVHARLFKSAGPVKTNKDKKMGQGLRPTSFVPPPTKMISDAIFLFFLFSDNVFLTARFFFSCSKNFSYCKKNIFLCQEKNAARKIFTGRAKC